MTYEDEEEREDERMLVRFLPYEEAKKAYYKAAFKIKNVISRRNFEYFRPLYFTLTVTESEGEAEWAVFFVVASKEESYAFRVPLREVSALKNNGREIARMDSYDGIHRPLFYYWCGKREDGREEE